MGTQTQSHTYLPPRADARDDLLAVAAQLYAAQRHAGGATPYRLCGPEGDIELPREVYEALRQVAHAMSEGQAVTVTPQEPVLTTSQAAELLGVSRPTVIKFINEGRLRAERLSNRRTLLLSDVLEFRAQRQQEQYDAIAATSLDLDSEAPLEDILAATRAARRATAASRRKTP